MIFHALNAPLPKQYVQCNITDFGEPMGMTNRCARSGGLSERQWPIQGGLRKRDARNMQLAANSTCASNLPKAFRNPVGSCGSRPPKII